jgi:Wax ester synthase/diacylglycerol acyltransferase catalytic domain/WS/DGAT C-terminal domain
MLSSGDIIFAPVVSSAVAVCHGKGTKRADVSGTVVQWISESGRAAVSVQFSAADLAVLNMERTPSNLHIGIVLLLDQHPDGALLEQQLAVQISRFPRLQQCLVDGPRPQFVQDANFAVGRHLRQLPPLTLQPDIATIAENAKERLLAAIAKAFVEPFDRDHPPWRIDVVGYSPGARAPAVAALCIVMHHVLSDGMGMVELLRALRDGQPAVAERPPGPGAHGALAARLGWRDRLRMAWQMVVDLFRPCHSSALTGDLGTARQLTSWEFPRDALKRICRSFDCSLPTALLAITSGALRRYQQAHDYHTSRDLSVFLPMSTRTKTDRCALGNRFVTFRVPLAIPTASPERRLERCRAEMHKATSLYPLRMSERIAQRSARLPRSWQRWLAQSPGRLTNLVFTLLPANLGGATICGARVLGCYGLPALLGVQGAALAFMVDPRMVCGQIVSDPQVVSDPGRLRQAFLDSFAEYLDYRHT